MLNQNTLFDYQLDVNKGKLATVANYFGKADISSISPSSEQNSPLLEH